MSEASRNRSTRADNQPEQINRSRSRTRRRSAIGDRQDDTVRASQRRSMAGAPDIRSRYPLSRSRAAIQDRRVESRTVFFFFGREKKKSPVKYFGILGVKEESAREKTEKAPKKYP